MWLLGYRFLFLIAWYDLKYHVLITLAVHNRTIVIGNLPQFIVFHAVTWFCFALGPFCSQRFGNLTRHRKCGRPSTVPGGNLAMNRVIACLLRICVDCADILIPDTQSGTCSVSLLALENTVLFIMLISPRVTSCYSLCWCIRRIYGPSSWLPNVRT